MQRAGNLLTGIVKPILNRYDAANHLLTVPRERAGNLLNRIMKPILNRYDANREDSRELLELEARIQQDSREEREARIQREAKLRWYFHDVADADNYTSAAFRSSAENEVYLFMGDEYVLLHYTPGTHNDNFVISGPNLTRKGFPALKSTTFAEFPINCAFGSHHENQAFIFFADTCTKVKYVPGTTDVKILEQTTINRMFPFLKGTDFENGIEAAFEASTMDEAYIFKRGKFARINYNNRDGRLIATNLTFNCLQNTIFESGIDAAFASHMADEAYLFTEDFYALINYAHDYIIGGVKKILPDGWPSLNGIFPRKNSGHTSDSDDEC